MPIKSFTAREAFRTHTTIMSSIVKILDSDTHEALEAATPKTVFIYLNQTFLFYREPKTRIDFATLSDDEFVHFTRFTSDDIVTVSCIYLCNILWYM